MHSIIFENSFSDRNEALPMGNGVFGGMVFYKDGIYTTAMNHYEVYYSVHKQDGSIHPLPPENYEAYVGRALEHRRNDLEEAFLHYRKTIWPNADGVKEASLHLGQSYPPTGEFSLVQNSKFLPDCFQLRLDIEKACISLRAEKDEKKLNVESRVLKDQDSIYTIIRQTDGSLLEKMEICYPQRRNQEGYVYEFFQKNEGEVGYRVITPLNKFRFCVLYHVEGAKIKAKIKENKMELYFEEPKQQIEILTHVVTELSGENFEKKAETEMAATVLHKKEELLRHRNAWDSYFQKSGIEIPDKFLERLWYEYVYIIGCCSGKGGKRFEHACGLNGLWDICQLTMWGSMWYWDVNIQSAFWGVYTSNHMEIAEAFCEGLLSYVQSAKKRAEKFYHKSGYAIDYPHEFYNCILPWCAQHLWWQFEYTQDMDFLRNKAYPFFRQLLIFVSEIVKTDERTGKWYIFPDVSPEQGPITKNATITIACIKYLLKICVRSNELLEESEKDRELFLNLLDTCPSYETAMTEQYGKILKDSQDAPDLLELRHPSLLMPVFPIGELSQYCDEKDRKLAADTVHFASEHTELGVFPFGWIASASARVGEGNTALRVLYEQGLDLALRANGMCAEETDRWINHCPAQNGRGQIYHPFMMESVGGLVSAVNEMLLQSFDGVIHLFPAIPNGSREIWREKDRQIPLVVREEQRPVCWKDCSFEKLLAKGGFEVSAKMRNGKIVFLKVKSLYGKSLKLEFQGKILEQETKAGETYVFTDQNDKSPDSIQSYHLGNSYVSHLGRRVFSGKDRHTDWEKLLDSFLFDSYMANMRRRDLVVYRISFGIENAKLQPVEGEKIYKPQMQVEKEFLKLTGENRYSDSVGIGFLEEALYGEDSKRGNVLIQDYLYGKQSVEFAVELPKGIYEILILSGGMEEECFTSVEISEGNQIEILSSTAGYAAGICTAVHKENGALRLKIRTKKEFCWNLNLMVIKKLYALI